MLPEGSIEATHIWKRFRADRHRRLLRDQVQRLTHRIRGGKSRGWRWALQDVNLVAEPGESIGLVGLNGSGKSTLLKILTRVMYPTAGDVRVAGRVGALIEVRAGIHPDLTGRENVYLYGTLLGMTRREVASRFDEIVAFAQVEDAIDRQVKFFSSGMQMRLGFSVAAFLEPRILLVDEVLAVGDASFQQKCLDRMQAVLAQGTTIVFVSHDLAAVESLCTRGIWLTGGAVSADGPVRDVLRDYRRSIEEGALFSPSNGLVRLLKAEVSSPDAPVPQSNGALELRFVFESESVESAGLTVGVSEGPSTPIFIVRRDVNVESGQTDVRCRIPHLPLPRGSFYVWVGLTRPRAKGNLWLLPWHPVVKFEVTGPDLDRAPRGIVRLAPVYVDADWGTRA